jgi:carboxypeptidase T
VDGLTADGILYQIIKDDISLQTDAGYIPGPANALGFGDGSMSGFYTFSEVLKQLDSMKQRYPNLITARDSIGNTREGRGIWAVKISDNPDVTEDNEPEVLYTALHHAREPEGMMTVLYYMSWLLQNYGTDSTATYLVNNRQIWFIPVVNPDGYCYNESLYRPGPPAYFGSWRKNRRNNGTSYGVDLNRNYGTYEMWNGPYGGSSTNPSDDTYRGPQPFSEPETFAIDDFMWSHNIMTCLNYHTYGNYLVFPWGYLASESEDSLTFREFAFDMVGENRYISGTDQQTVNYSTRGNSDDFMHAGTMTKTFAMTPEVGLSGFWPPTNEILPLAMKNLSSNQYYSYVAGQYTVLKHIEVHDLDGNGLLTSGETFSLETLIRNKGLKDAENLTVSISSSVPEIVFNPNSITLSSVLARSDSVVSFTGTIRPDFPPSSLAYVYLTFTTGDGYIHNDTASIIIGTPDILLADSGNSGISNWSIAGSWGTTGNVHTPPLAFTDSPAGNYSNFASNILTLKTPVDLSNYNICVLKFWTKWAIEPTADFAKIELSTDNGVSWISLRSQLSHIGSGYGQQYSGMWGYDGYTPGLDWIEQEINLTRYIPKNIILRFSVTSDGSDNRDGLYLDDIRILAYRQPIPIIRLTDSGSQTDSLFFGEFPHATSGIDPSLGEIELSSVPPQGTFDVRWEISGTNGSKRDLRDTLDINQLSNIYIAQLQPGPGGYPFKLKWNPQTFSPGGWHLRDVSTHGTLLNFNMLTDTGMIISDTGINSIEIVHTLTDTLMFPVESGWAMVSVPMISDNRAKSQLYPRSASDAFYYQGSYIIKDTLEYGKAYWIKYSNVDTFQLTGIPIVRNTIQLPSGWSMIGGLSCPVIISQMKCDPSPCQPYTYKDGYSEPTLINPNEGFWIKGPKNIVLSCIKASEVLEYKINSHEFLNIFNTITISDNAGGKAKLYFGSDDKGDIPLTEFELPPIPPSGSFDVRYSSQRTIEKFPAQTNSKLDATILLQSSAYPIKVEWDIRENDSNHYEFTNINGYIGAQSIINKGSMLISSMDANTLTLSKLPSNVIPRHFSLYRNYPNPFNPSTSLQFDIPIPSIVSLAVFNIMGQEVQSLIKDQLYTSGRYHTNFNGSSYSSGLYFYRLTAQPTNSSSPIILTDKMVLLK